MSRAGKISGEDTADEELGLMQNILRENVYLPNFISKHKAYSNIQRKPSFLNSVSRVMMFLNYCSYFCELKNRVSLF